jgi:uncharacterized RDD family membrane protein YckC
MNRIEQLKFCKVCKHQAFSFKHGIICGLTNQVADFDPVCDSFEEDKKIKQEVIEKTAKNDLINKTAGKEKRLANYLLDTFCVLILGFLFIAYWGFLMSIFFPNSRILYSLDNTFIVYLLFYFVMMIYYSTIEAITGRTIAKYITKTKVVNEEGKKPGYGTILIRTLCRLIPFDPLSFLLSDDSGWHDKLSQTKVINK